MGLTGLLLISALAAPSGAARKPALPDAYRNLPLAFVPNEGQTDPRVRYAACVGGASFWFTSTEVVLALPTARQGMALRLRFAGATPTPLIEGRQAGTGRVSYFHGKDPAKWQRGLPTYHELVYRELWPGIDMAVHGAEGRLKYEFVVRPGAAVDRIRLQYEGAERLALDGAGNLQVRTTAGTLTDERPTSFQLIDGRRMPVESRYRLGKRSSYGFAVGAYDRRYPVVIDPGVAYSTFLGGDETEGGYGIAVDSARSVYLTGETRSTNFPTTPGAFDVTLGNPNLGDAFVTKLDATGSLVYSTYLGGTFGDFGIGIAVDAAGNAVVAGMTSSSDFPTTAGAFDESPNGVDDVFVTKLNTTGSALVYSTFLGGIGFDWAFALAVDAAGSAFVTGQTTSSDFPTTAGSFHPSYIAGRDGFVTKLDPAGASLAYSTYFGGTGSVPFDATWPYGIAVDSAGSAYVSGHTDSPSFPLTAGAFDTSLDLGWDVFVTKFDAAGSTLIYSTLLGGSENDLSRGIAVDGAGQAYVTGFTQSSNFPTTPGAFDTSLAGNNAFITKLNATGSALLYSTYLGGSASDFASRIAVDGAGSAYVTGYTVSADFPTTAGAFDTSLGGGEDGFVTKLDPSGSALLYSTFLGGSFGDDLYDIAVDGSGNAYLIGASVSPDFPTTPGAFDTSIGSRDAVFVKLETNGVPALLTLSPVAGNEPVATSHTVTAHATDAGGPPAMDRIVRFSVSGSVSTDGSCTTDSAGECGFTYTGPEFPGTDVISAFADANENGLQDPGEPGGTATMAWVLPGSTTGRATGWGRVPNGLEGSARFSFSAASNGGLTGSCSVIDRARAKTINCLDVTAFVVNGDEVTIFGHATENGVATSYVIHAADRARRGAGLDTFSIHVASGYAVSGTLTTGNIRVRE